MNTTSTQKRWLKRVGKQLQAMEGVETSTEIKSRITLLIKFNGKRRKVFVDGSPSDPHVQKLQYRRIRKTLTELGIREQPAFAAPKVSSASGAGRQAELRAWQEVWRIIRKAEKSLDRWNHSAMLFHG